MKIVVKIILLSTLMLSASCAFFGNSKVVDLSITSNPAGADVVIEGRNYGKTPLTIKIEPKNYVVTLSKEGHGNAILNLETWQAVRQDKGEGGRCMADAIGTMLVIPYFSYNSVYCRDFKEKEYFVNIPYLGNQSGRVNNNQVNRQDGAAMADYYYNQDMSRYQNQQKAKQ